jgi:hypothetical protein
VLERALSNVYVLVERVASVAVLPVTCVVMLVIRAHGRGVSELYSSIVGELSSSWRFYFLLLDICLGFVGSSSLDLDVPEPCSSSIDARVKLEKAFAMFAPCVGEVEPSEVGRTRISDFCCSFDPISLHVGVSHHG